MFIAQLQGSDFKTIADVDADQPLAIGSAFKLYVLAQLVAEVESNQRHFEDVIHLSEDAKSLPSGTLQS